MPLLFYIINICKIISRSKNFAFDTVGGQTGEDVIHASMLSAVKDKLRWYAREALSQSHVSEGFVVSNGHTNNCLEVVLYSLQTDRQTEDDNIEGTLQVMYLIELKGQ